MVSYISSFVDYIHDDVDNTVIKSFRIEVRQVNERIRVVFGAPASDQVAVREAH